MWNTVLPRPKGRPPFGWRPEISTACTPAQGLGNICVRLFLQGRIAGIDIPGFDFEDVKPYTADAIKGAYFKDEFRTVLFVEDLDLCYRYYTEVLELTRGRPSLSS